MNLKNIITRPIKIISIVLVAILTLSLTINVLGVFDNIGSDYEIINSFSIERPSEAGTWEDGNFLEGLGYNSEEEYIFLEEGDHGVWQQYMEFPNYLEELELVGLEADISDFSENQSIEFLIFSGEVSEDNEWITITTEQDNLEGVENLEITKEELDMMEFGTVATEDITMEIKIDGENDGEEAKIHRINADFEHEDLTIGEEPTATQSFVENFGGLVLIFMAFIGIMLLVFQDMFN